MTAIPVPAARNPLPMLSADEAAFVPKTHVSLNVGDIEASVRFYEAFFGVSAHKRRPGYANFDIARPALKLALQEHPASEGGVSRLSHLGVQVGTAAEVNAARERLIVAGLATFDEGDTVCCYARQDKVWATDPDGNGWEVYVLLDEMDDEEDHHFEATDGGVREAHPGRAHAGDACCAVSARAKAGGDPCCAAPADGSGCCP